MKRSLSGHNVGAVGLGCMSFGGMYGEANLDESLECLARAVERGADHWDVAEIYGGGQCEEIIGTFLRQQPTEIILATKAGIYPDPDRPFNNSPDKLRESLEGSLERLGRDKVELFYIHRRDPSIEIEDVVETLAGFIEEGLIDSYGLSEVAPHTVRRAHAVHPVAAVQSEYSLWSRQPELGVIQTCKELGITFVAFSPLARGVLTDRFPDTAHFRKRDFRKNQPRFQPANYEKNKAVVSGFVKYCRGKRWSVPAAAIAWVLDQGEHILPIPGTRSASHFDQCVDAQCIEFTTQDREEIARLLPIGFAHGARYSDAQTKGIERYC